MFFFLYEYEYDTEWEIQNLYIILNEIIFCIVQIIELPQTVKKIYIIFKYCIYFDSKLINKNRTDSSYTVHTSNFKISGLYDHNIADYVIINTYW